MIEIRFHKTKDEVALLIWFLVDHSVFNAACPFSSEFLVKVTFVSTRPGILRSRRILNHAKPSITAGGMKNTIVCLFTEFVKLIT
jgi:hypothetical protein